MNDKIYTSKELSKLLQCSAATIYNWMDSGQLVGTWVVGKRRFYHSDLVSFLRRHGLRRELSELGEESGDRVLLYGLNPTLAVELRAACRYATLATASDEYQLGVWVAGQVEDGAILFDFAEGREKCIALARPARAAVAKLFALTYEDEASQPELPAGLFDQCFAQPIDVEQVGEIIRALLAPHA